MPKITCPTSVISVSSFRSAASFLYVIKHKGISGPFLWVSFPDAQTGLGAFLRRF